MPSRSSARAVALFVLVAIVSLRGQERAFEVASVKAIPATDGGSAAPIHTPGRVEYRGATLKNLVAGAYDTQVTRIIEGQAYAKELNKYRFNIEAKTGLPAIATPALASSVRVMLRQLLQDRFKVRIRMEQRESRYYVLMQGRNGPAFKPVDAEGRVLVTRIAPAPGKVVFTDASVIALANTMAGFVGEPVLNETGLTGFYNFTWQWILDNGEEISPAQAMENLGLHLEERRGPVEFVVIDTAQMPTAN